VARQSATGFTGSTGFLEGRFRRAPSLDSVLIGSWPPGSRGQDSWDQQGVSEPLRAVNPVHPVKMKQPAARQSATGFTALTGFPES